MTWVQLLKILKGMKTQIENFTDSQIVDTLCERYGFKQIDLSKRFYCSEAAISQARSGKTNLRTATRQGMMDLLRTLEAEQQAEQQQAEQTD